MEDAKISKAKAWVTHKHRKCMRKRDRKAALTCLMSLNTPREELMMKFIFVSQFRPFLEINICFRAIDKVPTIEMRGKQSKMAFSEEAAKLDSISVQEERRDLSKRKSVWGS